MTAAPRSAATAGFTLIEALVAFIVLAVLMVAVQRTVIASVDSSQRADLRVRAELVARKLITGPLAAGPGAMARQSGRMDGMDWSLQLTPATLSLPSAPPDQLGSVWTPVRLTVQVSDGMGRSGPLTAETIRLIDLGGP